jgi:hypothetical protein
MRALLFVGLVVLVVAGSAVALLGRNVELVATTAIPIGAEATIDPASARAIAVLEKGERVDVLSCTDLKHYMVPEVRLPDGRTGFVLGGNFELVRKSPSLHLHKPLVFSCS